MIINGNLAENIESARTQILFQHDPITTKGWITLAKKDPLTKRFRQYHYKPEELASHLSEWMGEDIYYSQNTFFKPQRRIDNIKQLRSLYVDLDVYNKGISPDWALGKLEHEYFRQSIPEPNMVIFSGRGLVLIWNIQPVPYMAMPLWRAIETHFLKMLDELGADPKACDPARIFRLAGTTNSKSKTIVSATIRHSYRYDIHDLQYDYLPELKPKPTKSNTSKQTNGEAKVARLFNTYTMHLVRARDIARLVEMRGGEVNSYRETICFLYRYFTCCCSNDPQKALEDTLSLNSEFTDPLPQREVETATKSAEKAWKATSDAKANEIAKAMGYPGAGYRISNAKLIDWLDITPEEQKNLDIIISAAEKRRRNTIAKRKSRREQGVKPMEEYNQERKAAVSTNAQKLQELMTENPTWTNAQLAEKMGVSVRTVNRLKKTLIA